MIVFIVHSIANNTIRTFRKNKCLFGTKITHYDNNLAPSGRANNLCVGPDLIPKLTPKKL